MIFLKLAIVGSREIENVEEVYGIICDKVPCNCTEIVSGGAEGVDKLAERYAAEHGIFLKVFLPEYEKYGKNATLFRNTEIVKYADCVYAFIHGEKPRGTADTAKKCLEFGKPLSVFNV